MGFCWTGIIPKRLLRHVVFGLSGMDEVYYDCIGLRFVDNQKVLEKAYLVDLSAFLKTWDDLTNEARSNHSGQTGRI